MGKKASIHYFAAILLAGVSGMAISGVARAQDAPVAGSATQQSQTQNVEEVVVTARKKNERLLDVPVAVTAMNRQQLERYAATDITAATNQIPQVSIDHDPSGNGALITVRGVTAGAQSDASIEQDVTINIDGVPTSRGRIIEAAEFDLDNLEVLKGPQALYFGKNSPAGVVSITSKSPGNEFEGYARLGYETTANDYSAEAAVSVPIIKDILSIRVAMRGEDMLGGYIHDVAVPIPAAQNPQAYERATGISIPGAQNSEYPGDKNIIGRFTAVFKPTDNFDMNFKFLGSNHHDRGDSMSEVLFSCSGAQTSSLDFSQFLYPPTGASPYISDPSSVCGKQFANSFGAVPTAIANNYRGSNGGQYFTDVLTYLSSLTMNYRFDNVTLTSVTGYYSYSQRGFSSFDFTDFALASGQNDEYNTSWTEEARATTNFDFPVNATIGFFYEHDDRHFVQDGDIGFVGNDPSTGRSNFFGSLDTNTNDSYSGFGELNWKILPDLELAGGARFSYEDKQATLNSTYVNEFFNLLDPGGALPAGQHISGEVREYNVSPQVTLTWHPIPNTTLYAAYKTGFKSGGFSNPALIPANGTSENQGYGLEKVKGGEIGFKMSADHGRISGDLTAYHYDFNGLQLTAFQAATTSFYTQNAGSSSINGLEGNLNYKFDENLGLHGGFGYNRARYDSFPAAQCFPGQTSSEGCVNGLQNLAGHPLERAPNWAWTAGFTYDRPIYNDIAIGLTTDVRYSGGYFLEVDDSPYAYQSSYITVDASLRIHDADDIWEFAVIGRNLTDKYYGLLAEDKPLGPSTATSRGDVAAEVGQPRTVLFQATYRFGSAGEPPEAAPPVPPPAVVPPPAPPAPPAPAPEAKRAFQVFFDFDKSTITPDAAAVLQQAAASIKQGNNVRVMVIGHTDTVGSVRYNQKLSERRANAVKTQLISDGVADSEIETKGVGKTDLLVPTPDGVREPQNRRAEIIEQQPGA